MKRIIDRIIHFVLSVDGIYSILLGAIIGAFVNIITSDAPFEYSWILWVFLVSTVILLCFSRQYNENLTLLKHDGQIDKTIRKQHAMEEVGLGPQNYVRRFLLCLLAFIHFVILVAIVVYLFVISFPCCYGSIGSLDKSNLSKVAADTQIVRDTVDMPSDSISLHSIIEH